MSPETASGIMAIDSEALAQGVLMAMIDINLPK